MKKLNKIFITAGLFIFFITLTLFLASNYLSNQAVSAISAKDSRDSKYFTGSIIETTDSKDPVEIFTYDCFNKSYKWLKENSSVCSLQSFDGLQLNAYYAQTEVQSHNYAVIVHGWKSEPKNVSPYAQHFYEKGFNILLPGLRGHGWSDGNYVDMGYFSKHDIKAWCDYLIEKDPQAKIVLWGVSMGGATVMLTTGMKLPSNIICAIEDCGYSNAWDQINYRLKVEYNLPSFPLMYTADFLIGLKYGFNLKNADCIEAVKKSVTPTLFIHGVADDYIPVKNLTDCFEAANCQKEILKIEGAKHARSAFKNPEKYWATVDSFVDRYFNQPQSN